MFAEFGCYGRVVLGDLPAEVVARLEAVPAEWLEYNAAAGTIEVRYVQPSDAPVLPTVVSELVHMLDAIPHDLLTTVAGGQLLVHTEDEGRLVRIAVDAGGSFHVQWAQPDYAGSKRRPFAGHEIEIPPYEQRLWGRVSLRAPQPAAAARSLQELADTYEGLYPEGDFKAVPSADGTVFITLDDVNLDARLLIDALERQASPRSLKGRLTLGSFKEAMPEHMLRLVFESGKVWVERPILWSQRD